VTSVFALNTSACLCGFHFFYINKYVHAFAIGGKKISNIKDETLYIKFKGYNIGNMS